MKQLPWTARRSNQSILKEINPGRTAAEAKALMFWSLMQRVDSLEKTLILGKSGGKEEGGGRGQDGWIASPT